MNFGWLFVFCLVVGIPIAGILSGVFGTWLRYRYRRAALETLKTYAASGKDPPEAVIKALTESTNPHRQDWSGHDWAREWEGKRNRANPDETAGTNGDRREWRAWRYRRRHSAVHAWKQASFWVALTLGFWLSAEYVAGGDTQRSLTIVAIILGAVAVASTLGAIVTTVARANDRNAD